MNKVHGSLSWTIFQEREVSVNVPHGHWDRNQSTGHQVLIKDKIRCQVTSPQGQQPYFTHHVAATFNAEKKFPNRFLRRVQSVHVRVCCKL